MWGCCGGFPCPRGRVVYHPEGWIGCMETAIVASRAESSAARSVANCMETCRLREPGGAALNCRSAVASSAEAASRRASAAATCGGGGGGAARGGSGAGGGGGGGGAKWWAAGAKGAAYGGGGGGGGGGRGQSKSREAAGLGVKEQMWRDGGDDGCWSGGGGARGGLGGRGVRRASYRGVTPGVTSVALLALLVRVAWLVATGAYAGGVAGVDQDRRGTGVGGHVAGEGRDVGRRGRGVGCDDPCPPAVSVDDVGRCD